MPIIPQNSIGDYLGPFFGGSRVLPSYKRDRFDSSRASRWIQADLISALSRLPAVWSAIKAPGRVFCFLPKRRTLNLGKPETLNPIRSLSAGFLDGIALG